MTNENRINEYRNNKYPIKKYFVYISSTHDDLKAERLVLAGVITEMGAIPVTTDSFDIALEEDRRIIRKVIEECDYFVNITGFKAGTPVGKFFGPELEYSFALKAKVPVLALLINEKARRKDSKKEKDPAALKSLEAFRRRLEARIHETWISQEELKQKALFLMSREMNLNPRRGWVPSNEMAKPSVANVLSMLIQENEILKSRLAMEGTDIVKKVRENMKKALKILAANRISLSFYYTNGENWENTNVFRYIRLFRLLAPELSTPKTVSDISHFLGNILNPDLEKTVRRDYPVPSNTIKKIMTDFTLLKLVKVSGGAAHRIAGAIPAHIRSAEYSRTADYEAWEMTEYGRECFAVYRLRQMSRVAKKQSE